MQLAHLVGGDGPADQHLRPAGVADGHPDRGAGRLVAVVGGDVDDVHLQQLGHHADVLEQGLEPAVVLVRLARVGGEELAAPVDLVADGRHVVRVAAVAEEAERLGGVGVAAQQPAHVRDQLVLGDQRLGQVQRPVQAQVRRNGGVELLDARGADGRQHLGPHAGFGVRDVGVCHRSPSVGPAPVRSTTASRAGISMRPRRSRPVSRSVPGSARSIRAGVVAWLSRKR